MINLEQTQIDRLLEEPLIKPRVKIESLLMPYLGLRQCTQVTIPAEFPEGLELGRKIDESVKPLCLRCLFTYFDSLLRRYENR